MQPAPSSADPTLTTDAANATDQDSVPPTEVVQVPRIESLEIDTTPDDVQIDDLRGTQTPFESELGVALVPANLPDFDDDDVQDMLARTQQVGTGIAILSWDDPAFLTTATAFADWSDQQGIALLLAINPTSVTSRADLIVPQALRPRDGTAPSFTDAAVHEAFVRDSIALAKLNPQYLCLGTELNLLADGNRAEFDAFLVAYEVAYDAAKLESPSTSVFTSFHWDIIYAAAQTSGGFDAASDAVINAFRPRLDVLALTSYPAGFWFAPADVPTDFYSSIDRYRADGERLALVEIGWPSEGTGSLNEQMEFIERIPAFFSNTIVELLGWSLLHDVPPTMMPLDLASTGLLDSAGGEKAAWNSFLALSSTR